MIAPKCKLCGDRHFGLCADAGRARKAQKAPHQPKAVREGKPKPKAPVRGKFDRVAYQRDYVKRWRKGLAGSAEHKAKVAALNTD
jgi:hypothetical protein